MDMAPRVSTSVTVEKGLGISSGHMGTKWKRALHSCAGLVTFEAGNGLVAAPAGVLPDCHAGSLEEARPFAVPILCGWSYLVRRLDQGRAVDFDEVLDGLSRVAELGFHFIEVEAYGRIGANALHERREELRERLEGLGLRALVFSYADHTLVDTDFRNEARFTLERFQDKALPAAKALDAEVICLNSFTPSAAWYVDPEQDPDDAGYYRWPPYTDSDLETSQVKLSEGFRMKSAWSALVSGCKIAAELARREGLPVALRARRRELCENASDLVNLLNDVCFSNFYAALDTALMNSAEEFLYAARKVVELPRLPGRVQLIYAADNDGRGCLQLPLRETQGPGGVDWDQFARILQQPLFAAGQPFRGPFILEVSGTDLGRLDEDLLLSAHRAQSLLTSHGIPWLI